MKRYIICLILSFFAFMNLTSAAKVNRVDIDVSLDETSGKRIYKVTKNDEKEIRDNVKKAIGDSVKVANEVKINDAKSRARQLRRDN